MSEEEDTIRRELEGQPTEELVSILRNRDEGQWRPEVFGIVASILAARGVSAADVEALGPEDVDVVEEQELVTIGHYFTPHEAHGLRMALEEANLPAWVSEESGGTMFGVGIGSRLQVRAADEAAARAVLEAAAIPTTGAPPLAEQPCPRCGVREMRQGTALSEPPAPPDAGRARGPWRYECASCGHSWTE
jgi:hypothetical protein